MILEGIQTIRGGAGLHPRREYEQCIENGYISCRGENVSNAMRRAPLCIEKMVKSMCNSIVLLYVGDLRRRRALSQILIVMRAI